MSASRCYHESKSVFGADQIQFIWSDAVCGEGKSGKPEYRRTTILSGWPVYGWLRHNFWFYQWTVLIFYETLSKINKKYNTWIFLIQSQLNGTICSTGFLLSQYCRSIYLLYGAVSSLIRKPAKRTISKKLSLFSFFPKCYQVLNFVNIWMVWLKRFDWIFG